MEDGSSLITRPMLAAKLDNEDQIKYPVYVTPKLDGIRCLIIDGVALTRKFKKVPNRFVQEKLSQLPSGLDGEIVVPEADFNTIQSKIMSENGEPDFEYHVFDWVRGNLNQPYIARTNYLKRMFYKGEFPKFVKPVLPVEVARKDILHDIEKLYVIQQKYEGLILRSKDGPYKCGRSTIREGYLLKLKRFKDSEAKVIALEQLMHNENEAKIDELGYTKRSKAKANLRPVEKLGAFVVKDIKTQAEFKVSTGMTDEQRLTFWKKRYTLIGKLIRYAYQKEGMKNLPRFPVFQGFRDERDL